MTAKLDIRNPSHQRLLARAAATTPPPDSWWARRNIDGTPLKREQWQALADDAAKRFNAVTTTQAIQRTGDDR